MAKEVIGYVTCPDCGYENAEVKETKRMFQGKAIVMRWCPHPDCLSQYFPRGKAGSERIRARMRPVDGPAPEPEPKPAPAPKDEPPAPAKRKSLFEELV